MPRPADHSQPAVAPDSLIAVWTRRKWLALAAAAAVLVAVVSLTLALPTIYRASATVLVERQQVSEAFVRPSVTAELETRIQTLNKQVMSRARLSELIERLDLYPELRGIVPVDALVERMRRDTEFTLSGVDQTTGRSATIAFAVSYSGRDPRTVAAVANTLVGFYVEENTRSRERQATRTADFLKTQLDEAKRQLDAQEQRSGDFKLHHAGELPQQVEVNLAALDRLNTQLRLNGEYQVRAMERRERLERQLAEARPSTESSGTAPDPLARLEQQLADLRGKYSDRYPDVVRLKAAIATLRQQAAPPDGDGAVAPADPEITVTRQGLAQIENELASLKNEERLLREVIAGYEARVENAPKRQEELQQLSRDHETSKDRYDTLLKRFEEAQLAENLEQGQNVEQFRVLDPALPPTRPAAPNRLWLLAIGVAAAFGMAVAAVVGAEKLDTTFHTVEDLRAFAAIPTLAIIRRIPTRSHARGRRLRVALVAVCAILMLLLIGGGAYYFGSGNEQVARLTVRGRG